MFGPTEPTHNVEEKKSACQLGDLMKRMIEWQHCSLLSLRQCCEVLSQTRSYRQTQFRVQGMIDGRKGRKGRQWCRDKIICKRCAYCIYRYNSILTLFFWSALNQVITLCCILVAWLSLYGGASRQVTNATLRGLKFIISAIITIFVVFVQSLGHEMATPIFKMPQDICTVYTRCGLEPHIIRTACCPTCFSSFPPGLVPSVCPWRKNPARGTQCGEKLVRSRRTKTGLKQVPKTYINSQSFDSWLRSFLARPDIEAHLETSYQKQRTITVLMLVLCMTSAIVLHGRPFGGYCSQNTLSFLVYTSTGSTLSQTKLLVQVPGLIQRLIFTDLYSHRTSRILWCNCTVLYESSLPYPLCTGEHLHHRDHPNPQYTRPLYNLPCHSDHCWYGLAIQCCWRC